MLSAAPSQWLGDVSYGVYLWHWPLLVLVPFAVDGPSPLLVLALTLLAAWATKYLVEDPLRFCRSARPALAVAVAASALLLTACSGASAYVERQIAGAERAPPRCSRRSPAASARRPATRDGPARTRGCG